MEIKAQLKKPYTEFQRTDFIVEYNHNQGYEIRETDEEIQAWGYTEEEIALQEKERIAMLNLTAADVERAIYKAKGIDFEDVISSLSGGEGAREGVNIDLKALKIELKANNFYRGNPYIDAVGTILGLTTEQLNRFFDTNDYKYLTTVTLTINPTPADAVVLINGEAQESVTVPYGDTVNYSVAKEGYLTQSGSVEMTEDKTIDVELAEELTPDFPEGEGVNEGVNDDSLGGDTPQDLGGTPQDLGDSLGGDSEDSAGTGD